MIILQESETEQTISFAPRSATYTILLITDESTNIDVEVTILASSIEEYYHNIEAVFPTIENHFYKLVLKNGANIVFKDRVLCTNQSISTHTVNNGVYTQPTSNNDFLMYE